MYLGELLGKTLGEIMEISVDEFLLWKAFLKTRQPGHSQQNRMSSGKPRFRI